MLKIRLQREGRKNDPSYRMVVTEHTRGTKSQKHVDRVGFYHPKTKEQNLNEDRIKHWLSVGAQASGTVHNMLVRAGIIKADTVNVLPKKTPIVAEKTEEEVAPAADVAETEEAPAATDEPAAAEESVDGAEAPVDEPSIESTTDEVTEDKDETPETPATEAEEATPTDTEDKPAE